MHWTRTDVADQQEGHLLLPARESAHKSVPEPAPEDGDPSDLEPPPVVASTSERLLDQEPVRVCVQVEPRQRENGVAAIRQRTGQTNFASDRTTREETY